MHATPVSSDPVIRYIETESPIGMLTVTSDGNAITGLFMETYRHAAGNRIEWIQDTSGKDEVLSTARGQISEYFAGTRERFELPLHMAGTTMQREVWAALTRIPYGETRSYGAIAAAIGNTKASRAVGSANGRNPISIIVPCHRVVGANGSLTGFGGGVERKAWLLAHEARVMGLRLGTLRRGD